MRESSATRASRTCERWTIARGAPGVCISQGRGRSGMKQAR